MSGSELKPCPFCGGKDGTNGNFVEVFVYRMYLGFRGCVECGCGATMHSNLYDHEQDAYEAAVEEWNQRVQEVC